MTQPRFAPSTARPKPGQLPGRGPGSAAAVMLAAIVLLVASRGHAAPPGASSNAPSRVELPLSPLPETPSIELPTPKKHDLVELDAHLDQLTSDDPVERKRAERAIVEVSRDRVPAIARRIDTIAERSDRRAMDRLLDDIRDAARDAVRTEMRARGEKGKVQTPDYLEMVLEHARPDDPNWSPLVRILALSRMLEQIGTMAAIRELIRIRVRFEFLRIDVQLQLEDLGERALAALIETQKHPARSVSRWATRRLDLRGKAIPSETVQTEDLDVLADVLRAYGRIRDADAARLIISFANSERAQVRLAARQAVRMLGEVAQWQLRDTYENIVGKKPPREWSWERTARELFTEFDRLRLSRVYEIYSRGKEAHEAGKLDEAVEAYDAVLVRSPEFEHGSGMVSAYLAFAQKNLTEAPDKARAALSRARRLAGDDLTSKAVDSLLLTLEAKALLDERGIADQVLLRRAIELDPSNATAQSLLDGVQRGDVKSQTRLNRHIAAGAIGLVALATIAWLFFRRPRPEAKTLDSSDPATNQDEAPGRGAPKHDETQDDGDPSKAIDATNENEEGGDEADGDGDRPKQDDDAPPGDGGSRTPTT